MTIDPQQLLDLATQAGASHAEVYQSRSLSRPVFLKLTALNS